MHTYIHYHHHHLLLLCRGRACVWRGQWGGGWQELSHGQEDALSRVPEREGSLEAQIQGEVRLGWVQIELDRIDEGSLGMVLVDTYIHICMHKYVYIYIHTYIHTYVRTYVRIYHV